MLVGRYGRAKVIIINYPVGIKGRSTKPKQVNTILCFTECIVLNSIIIITSLCSTSKCSTTGYNTDGGIDLVLPAEDTILNILFKQPLVVLTVLSQISPMLAVLPVKVIVRLRLIPGLFGLSPSMVTLSAPFNSITHLVVGVTPPTIDRLSAVGRTNTEV